MFFRVGLALVCSRQISAQVHLVEFQAWTAEHGKHYESDVALERAFKIFIENEAIIAKLNDDPDDSAEYGHTVFSDMSPSEFHSHYFGVPAVGKEAGCTGGNPLPPPSDPPSSFDWQDEGAVTPVKDQSFCGSCWAESAIGNVESQWYLARKTSMQQPEMLSVEQIIECDEYDTACYGGFPSGAYKYMMEVGGLSKDADYPWAVDGKVVMAGKTVCLANQTFNATCGDGMCDDPPLTSYCDLTCSDKSHPKSVQISSWSSLPEDEDQLAAHLAERGPISVAIDASGGGMGFLFPWLQFYKKGIANPKKCTDALDHAVLLVGFGEEKGTKYWRVKNSWGTKAGEAGYFRLIRGIGACGVNTCATTSNVSPAVSVV